MVGGLEPSMLEQLKASVLGKQRFGVGFELSESWDFMQMKVSISSFILNFSHSCNQSLKIGGGVGGGEGRNP